ncbi:MAG: carbohydrate porin [Rivularia sp. (in: Bacteria)]|nr:carbohydrate porin [Rivularia sp. MS3]
MSRNILNSYKYINRKPSSKVYTLLYSVSFLILWMIAFSGSATAQVQSSQEDSIQDLENSFIEKMKTPGGTPEKKSPPVEASKAISPRVALPVLTAQDISQIQPDLVSNFDSCNAQKHCQQAQLADETREKQLTFNQLLNPSPQEESSDNRKVQEFAAPEVANAVNARTYIAPLPPLPGTQKQPQLNNSVESQPTFNQLLYSSPNQTSGKVNPSFSNNPLLNSPGFPSTVNETSQSVFNQAARKQLPELPSPVNQSTTVAQQIEPKPIPQQPTAVIRKSPVREPSLTLQGVYVTQGDDTSARARVTGIYPLTPQALFGATLDVTSEGSSFDDSRNQGFNINELYFATSLAGLPNLRFVIGQMDLTSYFDRNSFAKDGTSHFFNPVFQTNPALSSTGIASSPGMLVNWNVTDKVAAKAAIFSSSQALSDFSLDGFAGEIGIRHGNAIIRGTYATARDGGNRDSFGESFGIARGNNQFGPLEDDREESYGINAEVFIPEMKLGLFGRYGRYENRDLGEGGQTYSLGLSFLDLLTPDDRLGLAYGRALSNDSLRTGKQPDVVELYYDFKFLPNLRLGLSFQGRDSFDESVLGIRVKSEFDITPNRRKAR